jgi:hypothetical protein
MFSRLYACIVSAPKWRRLTSGIFVHRHCSCVAIKFEFIKYPTCIWTFSPCYRIACYRQVHGSRFELTVSKKPSSIYLEITVSKTTKFDRFRFSLRYAESKKACKECHWWSAHLTLHSTHRTLFDDLRFCPIVSRTVCATLDSLDRADSQDYSLNALLSPTRLGMGLCPG